MNPNDPLQNVNDPAILQYLMQQGALGQEVSDQDRQALMAQQLRQRSGTPEGRHAGGLYVAANPLEHVASALGQGMANKQQADWSTKMGDIGQRRQRALADLVAGIGGGGGGGGAAPPREPGSYFEG